MTEITIVFCAISCHERRNISRPVVPSGTRENYADAALRFRLDHRGPTLVSIISSLGNYQNRPEILAPAIISIYSQDVEPIDEDATRHPGRMHREMHIPSRY